MMRQTGMATMGSFQHTGEDSSVMAAKEIIAYVPLGTVKLRAARGILVNSSESVDTLRLCERKQVMNAMCARTNADAIDKFRTVSMMRWELRCV